jgi:hypothetical protein
MKMDMEVERIHELDLDKFKSKVCAWLSLLSCVCGLFENVVVIVF